MSEVSSTGPNFNPIPAAPTPSEVGFETNGFIEAYPGNEASSTSKETFLAWCIEDIRAVATDPEARQVALENLKEYAVSEPEVPMSDPMFDTYAAAHEEAAFARDVIAAFASGTASLRVALARSGQSEGLQASIYLAGELAATHCYYRYGYGDQTLGRAINASTRLAQEMWVQKHGYKPYAPVKQLPDGSRFIDEATWTYDGHIL